MLQLYGNSRSRAMRCLWMLEEMGKPYQLIEKTTRADDHERRSRITRHTSGLPLTVDRRGPTRANPRTRLIASPGGASFRDER